VVKQLASAEGVLGYSVLARPVSKRFWTLYVWKDEAALRTFVQYPPHVRIMTALTPHMGETKFVRWTVKGPNYLCVGTMRCAGLWAVLASNQGELLTVMSARRRPVTVTKDLNLP
jgi:quinol monooxygenase YgiN